MRQFLLPLVTGLLAVGLAPQGSLSFAAEFARLVRHVPDSANALVLVNAEGVFASAVAKSEDWQGNREQRFAAGLTSIPPRASQMVIAAQFDLEFMHPIWELALVESESPPLLSSIARQFGGALDKVAAMPAVRLPDDAFIIEFSSHLRGGMAPANRQQVARWIFRENHNLAPYLQQAVGYADKTAHVIMALDVTEALTADDIAHRMGANMDVYRDVLRKSELDPPEIAQLLASMKGVMLGITFRDRAYARIRVDFGSDASKLASIAKPLLLAVLEHRGAMIEDFNEWSAEVSGPQIIFSGPLSSSGVMRLSSLVELPSQAMASGEAQGKDDAADKDAQQASSAPPTKAQATLEYFKRTEGILQDLRRHKGQAKTIGTIGLWFGNYARKIERLPMLNVDKEMLDYGTYLAAQLRNASLAIKGVGIRSRPEEIAASNAAGGGGFAGSYGAAGGAGWGGYRYGRYGSFAAYGSSADYVMARAAGDSPAAAAFATAKMELRQQEAARIQVRAQEKARGATTVQGIIAQIQTATAKIRRDMTEKYQLEF